MSLLVRSPASLQATRLSLSCHEIMQQHSMFHLAQVSQTPCLSQMSVH